jgi:LAO/AO transport system kinase
MARFIPSIELLPRVLAGESASVARLMSRAEAVDPECRETLARIYECAGRAHVMGITGVPGSGKSTLVAILARHLRARGQKIGIVAVDPSSPYSGGSIMGDRIRMSELAPDEGVFIRSMATRGAQGGLARATLDSVDILDAAGFTCVLIETVGVGQDEVEIAQASRTTVVVSAPGLGDEIQAIKAGILEIADIHVVSKCDRSDANRTISDLKAMLRLGMPGPTDGSWQAPVVATSSLNGTGFEELIAKLDEHQRYLSDSPAGESRKRRIAEFRVLKTAEDLLRRHFAERLVGRIDGMTDELVRRRISPYAAAEELLGLNSYRVRT